MDSVVRSITNLSASGDFQTLYQKLQSNEKTINQNQDQILQAIQNLDPVRHSLGLLFLYLSRFETFTSLPPPHQDSWLGQAERFLVSCDVRQVQFDEKRFFKLCRQFVVGVFHSKANVQKHATRAIPVLRRVIDSFVPAGEVTSLHSDFLKLCIMTSHYDLAEPLVHRQYISINKDKTGIEPKHFITFAYYAGCVALVLKNLPKALHFFSLALTTPSLVLHAAAVEAYKKYILVSLMLSGTSKQIPKHASTVIFYFAKELCEAYVKVAEAFSQRDTQLLDNLIAGYTTDFVHDKNLGLVKQVREAYTQQEVKRITNSYMTISLRSLSQSAGKSVSEVEALLLQMIEEGHINAQIDMEHEMVVFSETEEDSEELVERMSRVSDRLSELLEQTELRIENMMLSKEYIKRTLMNTFGVGAGGDAADMMAQFMP